MGGKDLQPVTAANVQQRYSNAYELAKKTGDPIGAMEQQGLELQHVLSYLGADKLDDILLLVAKVESLAERSAEHGRRLTTVERDTKTLDTRVTTMERVQSGSTTIPWKAFLATLGVGFLLAVLTFFIAINVNQSSDCTATTNISDVTATCSGGFHNPLLAVCAALFVLALAIFAFAALYPHRARITKAVPTGNAPKTNASSKADNLGTLNAMMGGNPASNGRNTSTDTRPLRPVQ